MPICFLFGDPKIICQNFQTPKLMVQGILTLKSKHFNELLRITWCWPGLLVCVVMMYKCHGGAFSQTLTESINSV